MRTRTLVALCAVGLTACGILGNPNEVPITVASDDAGNSMSDGGDSTPEFLTLEADIATCASGTWRQLHTAETAPDFVAASLGDTRSDGGFAGGTIAWATIDGGTVDVEALLVDDTFAISYRGSDAVQIPTESRPGSVLLAQASRNDMVVLQTSIVGPTYAKTCTFDGGGAETTLSSRCTAEDALEEELARENMARLRDVDILGLFDDQTWQLAPSRSLIAMGGSRGDAWQFLLYDVDGTTVDKLALPLELDDAVAGSLRLLVAPTRSNFGYPALSIARRPANGLPTTSLLVPREDRLGFEIAESLGTPPPSASMEPGKFVFLAETNLVLDAARVDPDRSSYTAGWAALDEASKLWLGRVGGFGALDLASIDLELGQTIERIELMRDWRFEQAEWLLAKSTGEAGSSLSVVAWDLGLGVVVNQQLSETPWSSIEAATGITFAGRSFVVASGTREGSTGVFVMGLEQDRPCPRR